MKRLLICDHSLGAVSWQSQEFCLYRFLFIIIIEKPFRDVAISTEIKGYHTPPRQSEGKVSGGHFSDCTGEDYCFYED